MAKAKVTQFEIVEISYEQGLTLELSKEEAQVLFDILMRVGGDPVKSRRGIAEKVYDVIRQSGVIDKSSLYEESINIFEKGADSLYFKNNT